MYILVNFYINLMSIIQKKTSIIALHPTRNLILVGSDEGYINVIDINTNTKLKEFFFFPNKEKAWVQQIIFGDPYGDVFISFYLCSQVIRWNINSTKIIQTFNNDNSSQIVYDNITRKILYDNTTSLCKLYTLSHGKIKIWNVETGHITGSIIDKDEDFIISMCFVDSTNKLLLTTTRQDNKIKIWDTTNCKCVKRLSTHNIKNEIYPVSFEQYFITDEKQKGILKLWDYKLENCATFSNNNICKTMEKFKNNIQDCNIYSDESNDEKVSNPYYDIHGCNISSDGNFIIINERDKSRLHIFLIFPQFPIVIKNGSLKHSGFNEIDSGLNEIDSGFNEFDLYSDGTLDSSTSETSLKTRITLTTIIEKISDTCFVLKNLDQTKLIFTAITKSQNDEWIESLKAVQHYNIIKSNNVVNLKKLVYYYRFDIFQVNLLSVNILKIILKYI